VSWLAGRAENTRRAYTQALASFAAHTTPETATGDDVADWVRALRRGGASEATIAVRLAALRAYYAGTERNPAMAVARPGKLRRAPRRLSGKQRAAFLAAIPRYTVAGLRDYALCLAYLETGWRGRQVRLLTWRGVCERSFPQGVRDAVEAYLDADARQPQADGVLFLTTATSSDRPHPLSARSVRRIIKRYAQRAGLNAAQVCVATLANTARSRGQPVDWATVGDMLGC